VKILNALLINYLDKINLGIWIALNSR